MVQIVGLEGRHGDRPGFEGVGAQPQIVRDVVHRGGVDGAQIHERTVAQPVETPALAVAG